MRGQALGGLGGGVRDQGLGTSFWKLEMFQLVFFLFQFGPAGVESIYRVLRGFEFGVGS
jgi:hypothetical protein